MQSDGNIKKNNIAELMKEILKFHDAHTTPGLKRIGKSNNERPDTNVFGVIFGRDLRYSFDTQNWIGDRSISADSVVKRSKDNFPALVKNTYRVLLSRGLKGCYVYFQDKETERFFKSRMEM